MIEDASRVEYFSSSFMSGTLICGASFFFFFSYNCGADPDGTREAARRLEVAGLATGVH